MYPTITMVFGHFLQALGQMSFLLKYASANLKGFSFLYIYIYISQGCAGFILESQLKSKFSHSLIHMGFIGLVTWSRVRGLWKNIREAQRVFEGYVWVRTSRALLVLLFLSTLGLGSTHFVFTLILIALLCLPCKIWRSLSLFFSSLTFGGFYLLFFFLLLPSFVHVLFALLF